jgi:GT2 family glycosyltransferase
MFMDLSIIVVSWNTRDFLRRCLTTIECEVEKTPQLKLETIVVDNASSDKSPQMVADEFSWAQLILNPTNKGFAAANNQGIRASSGRHVLLLNSDTEVAKGAFQELVQFMDYNEKAGAAGARLLNPDGTLQAGCSPMLTPFTEFWHLMFLDRIWPRSSYPLQSWANNIPRKVEVIKGACFVLRKNALNEVGLLDERYHMYTEEVDLCFRLAKKDWELWYIPTAVVTHYGGASSSQIAHEMYLQLYKSKVQFFRKFGGKGLARYYKFLLAFAYIWRILLRPRYKTYRQLLLELPDM